MSELTREQVEQLPGRLTEIHFNSMWALALATDAALRARILELEQALRLHLAVSPDDPLLIEPVEQEVVRLRAKMEAVQKQLPSTMQDCIFVFRECDKGHGRLTASNWLDPGCQHCTLEAVERERDDMRHYHDSAIEALYDQLGIDKSDGEIRTKWVALGISNLQQQLAAAQEQLRLANIDQVQTEAELNTLTTRLAEVEQFLEAQRTATYQAVEREHAAKKRLATVEEALRALDQAARSLECTSPYHFEGNDITLAEALEASQQVLTKPAKEA